ncbi:MAG: hypothetical protein ACE365_06755 [Gammaproteobacteria bacterium]
MQNRNVAHHVLEETQTTTQQELSVDQLTDNLDEYLEDSSHDIQNQELDFSIANITDDPKGAGKDMKRSIFTTDTKIEQLLKLAAKGTLLSKNDLRYLILVFTGNFLSTTSLRRNNRSIISKIGDYALHSIKVASLGAEVALALSTHGRADIIPHWAMQALSYAMENGQLKLIIDTANEIPEIEQNAEGCLYSSFYNLIESTSYPILHRSAMVGIGYLYNGTQQVPSNGDEILKKMLRLKNKVWTSEYGMAKNRNDSHYLNDREKNVINVRQRATRAAAYLAQGGYRFTNKLFGTITSLIERPENQQELYFEYIEYDRSRPRDGEGSFLQFKSTYRDKALAGESFSKGDYGYMYRYILEDENDDCLEALLVACESKGKCPPDYAKAYNSTISRVSPWGRKTEYSLDKVIEKINHIRKNCHGHKKFLAASLLCALKNHHKRINSTVIEESYRTVLNHVSSSTRHTSGENNKHQNYGILTLSHAILRNYSGFENHMNSLHEIYSVIRTNAINCFAIYVDTQITKTNARHKPPVENKTVAALQDLISNRNSHGETASAALSAISVLVSNRQHYPELEGILGETNSQCIIDLLNSNRQNLVAKGILLIIQKVKLHENIETDILNAIHAIYESETLNQRILQNITFIYAYLIKNHVEDSENRIIKTELNQGTINLIYERAVYFSEEEAYSYALLQYSRGVRNKPDEYNISLLATHFNNLVGLIRNAELNSQIRENHLKTIINLLIRNPRLATKELITCLKELIDDGETLTHQAISIISILTKNLNESRQRDLLDEDLINSMIKKMGGNDNQLSSNICTVILKIAEKREEPNRLSRSNYIELGKLLSSNLGFYFSQTILKKTVLEENVIINDAEFMKASLDGVSMHNATEISRFCSQLIHKISQHVDNDSYVDQFKRVFVSLLEYSVIDSFMWMLKSLFELPDNHYKKISEDSRVQEAVASAINLTGLSEEDRANIYKFLQNKPEAIKNISRIHLRNDLQRGGGALAENCLKAIELHILTLHATEDEEFSEFLTFFLNELTIIIDRKELSPYIYKTLNNILSNVGAIDIPEKIIHSCSEHLYFNCLNSAHYVIDEEDGCEEEKESEINERIYNNAVEILIKVRDSLEDPLKQALEDEKEAANLLQRNQQNNSFIEKLKSQAENNTKLSRTSIQYITHIGNKTRNDTITETISETLLYTVKNGQAIMWAARPFIIDMLSKNESILNILQILKTDDHYREHFMGDDHEVLGILENKFFESDDNEILLKIIDVLKTFTLQGMSLTDRSIEKMSSLITTIDNDEAKESILLTLSVLKDDPNNIIFDCNGIANSLVYVLKNNNRADIRDKVIKLLMLPRLKKDLNDDDERFLEHMSRLQEYYTQDDENKIESLNYIGDINFISENSPENLKSLKETSLDIIKDAILSDNKANIYKALEALSKFEFEDDVYLNGIAEKLFNILQETVSIDELGLILNIIQTNFDILLSDSYDRLLFISEKISYALRNYYQNPKLKETARQLKDRIEHNPLILMNGEQDLSNNFLMTISENLDQCEAILAYIDSPDSLVSFEQFRILVNASWLDPSEIMNIFDQYEVSAEWLEIMIAHIQKGYVCSEYNLSRIEADINNLPFSLVIKFYYHLLLSNRLYQTENYEAPEEILNKVLEGFDLFNNKHRFYALTLLSNGDDSLLSDDIRNELNNIETQNNIQHFIELIEMHYGELDEDTKNLINKRHSKLATYYSEHFTEEQTNSFISVILITLLEKMTHSPQLINIPTFLNTLFYFKTSPKTLAKQLLANGDIEEIAYNACKHWILHSLSLKNCNDMDSSIINEITQLAINTQFPPKLLTSLLTNFLDSDNAYNEMRHLKEILSTFGNEDDPKLHRILEHIIIESSNSELFRILNIENLHSTCDAFFVLNKCGYLVDEIEDSLERKNLIAASEIVSQLILKGWKKEDLISIYEILEIHSAQFDNYKKSDVLAAFEIILNYNISASRKNELIEFVDKNVAKAISQNDSNKNTYSKIFHKFAVKLNFSQSPRDKTVDELTDEFSKLNENDSFLSNRIKDILRNHYRAINEGNIRSLITNTQKPINEWVANDFKQWANAFKESKKELSEKNIHEVLCVMSHAVKLFTGSTNDNNGYHLRPAQLVAIIGLLLDESQNSIRLGEMATGEGKSTVIAVSAAIKALEGKDVDVIVSSSVLAARDSKEFNGFYELFNLMASHNADSYTSRNPELMKPCYADDINIVYGTSSQFEFDILRHEFKQYNTRGSRGLSYAIVDEADNIMLDQATSVARLSDPIPALDQLQWIYIAIWNYICKENIPEANIREERERLHEEITNMILNLIEDKNDETESEEKKNDTEEDEVVNEKISVPEHLHDFVKSQLPQWIENALCAKYYLENDKDYVIRKDESNRSNITPVDYKNTGNTLEQTQWSDGMHQFAQLKEKLQLTSEGLTTNFLSNLSLFRRYKSLIGLTGTLGDQKTREFLSKIYEDRVQTINIPQYRQKRFIEFNPSITEDKSSWLEKIKQNANRQVNYDRSVLIICESIQEADEIHKTLTGGHEHHHKIKKYSRSDEMNQGILDREIGPGEIIVATNLAGRGTDIKPSAAVKNNGGLHVIVTSLSINDRVCKQAYGRTSRAGAPGTAESIINRETLSSSIKNNISWRSLSEERNNLEIENLSKYVEGEVEKIQKDDQLFKEFCKLSKKVKKILQKRKYQFNASENARMLALIERWGLWYKGAGSYDNPLRAFEIFKNEILNDLKDGSLIKNPCYHLQEANQIVTEHDYFYHTLLQLGKTDSYCDKIINVCENVTDPLFMASAKSNQAYAYLKKNKNPNKLRARERFEESINQIQKINLPQMMAIQSLVFTDEEMDNELQLQIGGKIAILNAFSEAQDEAIRAIDKSRKLVDIITHRLDGNIETNTKLSMKDAAKMLEGEKSWDTFSIKFHDLRMTYDLKSTVRDDPLKLLEIAKSKNAANKINIYFENLVSTHCGQIFSAISKAESVTQCLNKIVVSENQLKLNDQLTQRIDQIKAHRAISTIQNITINCLLDNDKLETLENIIKNVFPNIRRNISTIFPGKIIINDIQDNNIKNILDRLLREYNTIQNNTIEEEKAEIEERNEILPPTCELTYEINLEHLSHAEEIKNLPIPPGLSNITLKTNDQTSGKHQMVELFNKLGSNLDNAIIELPRLSKNTSKALLEDLSKVVKEEEILAPNARNIKNIFTNVEKHKEIQQLILNGFQYFYELQERRPVQVYTLLALGSIAVAQAGAGAFLMACTGGFATSVGIGLISECFSDIIEMIQVGVARTHNWSSYGCQKIASLVIMFASAGISAMQTNAAKTARSAQVASELIEEASESAAKRNFATQAGIGSVEKVCTRPIASQAISSSISTSSRIMKATGQVISKLAPAIYGATAKLAGKITYQKITPQIYEASRQGVIKNVEALLAQRLENWKSKIEYISACARIDGVEQYDFRHNREIETIVQDVIASNNDKFGIISNTEYLICENNEISEITESCLTEIDDHINSYNTYDIKHVIESALKKCKDNEIKNGVKENLNQILNVLKQKGVIINNKELNENLDFSNLQETSEIDEEHEEYKSYDNGSEFNIDMSNLFNTLPEGKYKQFVINLIEKIHGHIYGSGRLQTNVDTQAFMDMVSDNIGNALTVSIMTSYEKSFLRLSTGISILSSGVGNQLYNTLGSSINRLTGLSISRIPSLSALLSLGKSTLDFTSMMTQSIASSIYIDSLKFNPKTLSVSRMQTVKNGVIQYNPNHRQSERYADDEQEEKMNDSLGLSFADTQNIDLVLLAFLETLSSLLALKGFEKLSDLFPKIIRLSELSAELGRKCTNFSINSMKQHVTNLLPEIHFWRLLKEASINLDNAEYLLNKILWLQPEFLAKFSEHEDSIKDLFRTARKEIKSDVGIIKNDAHTLIYNPLRTEQFMENLEALLKLYDEDFTSHLTTSEIHRQRVRQLLELLGTMVYDKKIEPPTNPPTEPSKDYLAVNYANFINEHGKLINRLLDDSKSILDMYTRTHTWCSYLKFDDLATKLEFSEISSLNTISNLIISAHQIDEKAKNIVFTLIESYLLTFDLRNLITLFAEIFYGSTNFRDHLTSSQNAIGKTLSNAVSIIERNHDIQKSYISHKIRFYLFNFSLKLLPIKPFIKSVFGYQHLFKDTIEIALFYSALFADPLHFSEKLLFSRNDIFKLGNHILNLTIGIGKNMLQNEEETPSSSVEISIDKTFLNSMRYGVGLFNLHLATMLAAIASAKNNFPTIKSKVYSTIENFTSDDFRAKVEALSFDDFNFAIDSIVLDDNSIHMAICTFSLASCIYLAFNPLMYLSFLAILSCGLAIVNLNSNPEDYSFKDTYGSFFMPTTHIEAEEVENSTAPEFHG